MPAQAHQGEPGLGLQVSIVKRGEEGDYITVTTLVLLTRLSV